MSEDTPAYPFGRDIGLSIDERYRRLLREEPISRVRLPYGGDAWLVLDFEANRAVLADRRFSRAEILGADLPRMFPQPMTQVSLLSMDPPDHTRIRRLVARTFSGSQIEKLRPRIVGHIEELLADLREAGPPADLMSVVAARLPLRVICLILGVPESDRDQFEDWSDAAGGGTRDRGEADRQPRLHPGDPPRPARPFGETAGAGAGGGGGTAPPRPGADRANRDPRPNRSTRPCRPGMSPR